MSSLIPASRQVLNPMSTRSAQMDNASSSTFRLRIQREIPSRWSSTGQPIWSSRYEPGFALYLFRGSFDFGQHFTPEENELFVHRSKTKIDLLFDANKIG